VPTQYFVTIGQIGVKAGDCVVHAGDTSTFMEGWGGAFGAPQYHVQTYVSTTDHTLVGEPSYTVTTTPGSREVWGQLQWSFSGLTQTDTISFNVRNVGSTTIRDHRSVTLLAGGTCSPDIEYTITVAEQV